MLVLLAATAGARVVAADLVVRAYRSGGTGAALLAAASRDAGGRRRYPALRRARVGDRALALRPALEPLVRLHLDAEEQLGHVEADVGVHLLEEVEPLEGVLLQRVALAVTAQADALAEHVHVVQVLLPVLVHHLQDNEALQLA